MEARIMKTFFPPTSFMDFVWNFVYSLALLIDGLTSVIMLGLWGTDLWDGVYTLHIHYKRNKTQFYQEDELEIIHDPPDPEL